MTERTMQERPLWLVYSREHNAFWRPNAAGYTVHIDGAGRYMKDEAEKHCRSRDFADADNPPEVAVLAPEVADRLDELEMQNTELLKLVEMVEIGADMILGLEADKAELLEALDGVINPPMFDVEMGQQWREERARDLIAKHRGQS